MAEEWSWPGKGEVKDPEALKEAVKTVLAAEYASFRVEKSFEAALEDVQNSLREKSAQEILHEDAPEDLRRFLKGLKEVAKGDFHVFESEWELIKQWNKLLTYSEYQICSVLYFEIYNSQAGVEAGRQVDSQYFDQIMERIQWWFSHIGVLNQFRGSFEAEVAPYLPEKERSTENWEQRSAGERGRKLPPPASLKDAVKETLDTETSFWELRIPSTYLKTKEFRHVLQTLRREISHDDSLKYGDLPRKLVHFLTDLSEIERKGTLTEKQNEVIADWGKLITKCEGMLLNEVELHIDNLRQKVEGEEEILHKNFEAIMLGIDRLFTYISTLNQFRGAFEAKVAPLLPPPEQQQRREPGGR